MYFGQRTRERLKLQVLQARAARRRSSVGHESGAGCRCGDGRDRRGRRLAERWTAYRQQALACAAALADGPRRPRDLKSTLPDASRILLSNVYGWFTRIERGVYGLTDLGRAALIRWPDFH